MAAYPVGSVKWDYSVERRLSALEHALKGLLDVLDQNETLSDELRQEVIRPLRELLGP